MVTDDKGDIFDDRREGVRRQPKKKKDSVSVETERRTGEERRTMKKQQKK